MRPGRGEKDVGDTGSERAASPPLDPEDLARANLYGLVSRLFYEPADPNLLAEICHSEQAGEGRENDGGLVAAWRGLQEACGSISPAAIRQEYDDLLVGVGRAQVTPYLCGYAEPSAPDRHLVRLREQLARLGFLRRSNAFEVEDHISALSDVMRLLIEEGHSLGEQQSFFASFVYPGAVAFFVAVQQAPAAGIYKVVAKFAHAFFEVEKEAFEMVDSS